MIKNEKRNNNTIADQLADTLMEPVNNNNELGAHCEGVQPECFGGAAQEAKTCGSTSFEGAQATGLERGQSPRPHFAGNPFLSFLQSGEARSENVVRAHNQRAWSARTDSSADVLPESVQRVGGRGSPRSGGGDFDLRMGRALARSVAFQTRPILLRSNRFASFGHREKIMRFVQDSNDHRNGIAEGVIPQPRSANKLSDDRHPLTKKGKKMSEIAPEFKISYAEKLERTKQNSQLLLNFLASGEQFTTLKNAALLLMVSESTARRLIAKMIRDDLLKIDERKLEFANTIKLYGITKTGIESAEPLYPNGLIGKQYKIGVFSIRYVDHHLESQRIHIKFRHATKFNLIEYLSERTLLTDFKEHYRRNVPDGIALVEQDGFQLSYAIETELHIKSTARMFTVVNNHLFQVRAGKYQKVWYFVRHGELKKMKNALCSVTYYIKNGEKHPMTSREIGFFRISELA